MGRNRKLIERIQENLDDIETEATRLLVFGRSIPDAALRGKLSRIAKATFRSATAIEVRLKKLGSLTSDPRLARKRSR